MKANSYIKDKIRQTNERQLLNLLNTKMKANSKKSKGNPHKTERKKKNKTCDNA